MTPQEITQQEADITVINKVFAKVFNSKISIKFQKFQNDFRLGKIKIEDAKLQELKELIKDYNTNKITQDEFVEKVDIWVENYS